jgi:putative protein-disulfide isomerase
MKPKLYYIFDPICGWCFGMSPAITALHNEWKDKVDFEVLSGGMVLGDRVGPIRSFAHIIQGSRARLEDTTGVRFGEPFWAKLEQGDMVMGSLKPSIALAVSRDLAPGRSIEFAAAIQRAIYVDGMEPELTEAYRPLAESFDLDADEFLKRMGYPHYEMVANKDFAQSAKWGIQGFPSVVVFHQDQGYLIARGYSPFETLDKSLREILLTSALPFRP